MPPPRNVRIHGQRTTIRLEPELWDALVRIGAVHSESVHAVCSRAALQRKPRQSLTSAVRSYIVRQISAAAE